MSDRVSVHLLLKGLVDPVAEIKKLEIKSVKVSEEITKLVKKMAAVGYSEKVPLNVQQSNAEQLKSLRKELDVVNNMKARYVSWGV